jgi:type I restriction enzyme M protein
MAKKTVQPKTSSATLGFESKLWEAANALRGSMDAAEYKHVVLGLIFLKYISDAFEEHRKKLVAEPYADPEDPDEYRAENIFWVPPEARWSELQKNARQPTIGQLVGNSMAAMERDNPSLKGVLPKDYARPALDKQRLGQLIDLVSNIHLGGADNHARDIIVGAGLPRPYFLGQFASAEGKKGGEFYTPRCVVKLLVEMLEPYRGRVYDPCCGSAGMFVQSVEFIEAHATGNGGRARSQISMYGQELNYTTWRLAKMNLAIRGIDGRIEQGDSFLNDRFPDPKADYILANPPFNMESWGGEHLREDQRWKYGVPPVRNANFAWVQHMIHHLAPTGLAGFVLANGSMSSNQSGEGEIRKNMIEADLVDRMVALPDKRLYSTQIPACLWFLARDKKNGRFRDRRGQGLFIYAGEIGRVGT